MKNFKNKIVLSLATGTTIAALSLGGAHVVFGEEGVMVNTTTTIEAKKRELEIKRDALKAEIEVEMKERIRKYRDHSITVFNEAIARIENAIARVESRFVKIEAKGNVDLNVAKAKIAEAKIAVTAAKAQVIASKAEVDALLLGTMSRESIIKIKNARNKARDAIKVAHRKVVEAITEIKKGLNSERKMNATTSVQVQ